MPAQTASLSLRQADFDISVIVPVYNTETYLPDTLESLERQSIGFDRIQVLLIDDGSVDNSAQICQEFARKHPSNVVYLSQRNRGVAAARNRCLDIASARIVTFLDSDDFWSKNAFITAKKFFDKHKNDIDVLVANMKLFESESDDHPLSYRFDDSETIINVQQEPCSIQSTVNCFILRESLNKIRFDEDLFISEDTLFLTKVISRKMKYACTSRCSYYYRKREDGSSATQNTSIKRHLNNLEVCRRLLNPSFFPQNSVTKYQQAVALYIICWQSMAKLDVLPTPAESDLWTRLFHEVVGGIDDDLLCSSPWLNRRKKIYLLRTKYGNRFLDSLSWVDDKLAYLNDMKVFSLNSSGPCNIFRLKRMENLLHIEGTTDAALISDEFSIVARDDSGDEIIADLYPFPRENLYELNGTLVSRGYRFSIDLPIKYNTNYSFHLLLGGHNTSLRLFPHFYSFARLDEKQKHSYFVEGNALVKYGGKRIRIFRYSKRMHFMSEVRKLRDIMHDKKYNKQTRVKCAAIRICFHIAKFLRKRPLWIFCDKEWKAGDNGENVYRWAVRDNRLFGHDLLFALSPSSADFNRVRAYGSPIDPASFRYKIAFLSAGKLISSRCEYGVLYPFGKSTRLIRDLLSFDFVYLTHGTLFGDLSSMLNKVKTNIALFSVSTNMEHDALLEPEYGYTNNEVKILGMARYDAYQSAKHEKLIVFLPTWRSQLAGKIIPGTTEREYSPAFKESEYCKFYNQLINDSRLIRAMKEFGYRGEFYVHPSHDKQASDFYGNDTIAVGGHSADYEAVLSTSSLLITDYSGVGFDFGYQRLPVVYTQFDSVFSGGHTYGAETYFDYENSGFGPVTHTVDEAVDAIIKYLRNGCRMDKKYADRADRLFGFSDYNACRRIIDAVIGLEQARAC